MWQTIVECVNGWCNLPGDIFKLCDLARQPARFCRRNLTNQFGQTRNAGRAVRTAREACSPVSRSSLGPEGERLAKPWVSQVPPNPPRSGRRVPRKGKCEGARGLSGASRARGEGCEIWGIFAGSSLSSLGDGLGAANPRRVVGNQANDHKYWWYVLVWGHRCPEGRTIRRGRGEFFATTGGDG